MMENEFGRGAMKNTRKLQTRRQRESGIWRCTVHWPCKDLFHQVFYSVWHDIFPGLGFCTGASQTINLCPYCPPIIQTTGSNIWNREVRERKSMQGSPKINSWLSPLVSNLLCYFLSCFLRRVVLNSSLCSAFCLYFFYFQLCFSSAGVQPVRDRE